MELSNLTISQLRTLEIEIPKEIKRREKDEKSKIRKELEALAAQRGYSLDEILNTAESASKTTKPVAAKYRNPEEASMTWSGRGRQPKWVQAYLANGGQLESLAI